MCGSPYLPGNKPPSPCATTPNSRCAERTAAGSAAQSTKQTRRASPPPHRAPRAAASAPLNSGRMRKLPTAACQKPGWTDGRAPPSHVSDSPPIDARSVGRCVHKPPLAQATRTRLLTCSAPSAQTLRQEAFGPGIWYLRDSCTAYWNA